MRFFVRQHSKYRYVKTGAAGIRLARDQQGRANHEQDGRLRYVPGGRLSKEVNVSSKKGAGTGTVSDGAFTCLQCFGTALTLREPE
jgi:hypothetical protein